MVIQLHLLNVGLVEETGGILLVLRAPDLERLLVIETGILEGQAVALEVGGVRSDRPLTHDLLHDTILKLGARVRAVEIHEFRDEAFHARILLARANGGDGLSIDARPSDAIALALRSRAPMYVTESILEEMGIPEEADGRFTALYAEEEESSGSRVVH